MGRGRVAGQQFDGRVTTMLPSELLPMAADRTTDDHQRAHVEDLAGRIRREGYKPGEPIHVALTDADPRGFLMNGNHRASALNLIGYRRPVPVRVTDLRSSKP